MSAPHLLKRDIFIGDRTGIGVLRFGHALVKVGGRSGASTAAVVAGSFAASAEKDQIVDHNLGHIFFLIGILVVPGSRLETAFDVHLVAFFQVFTGDLRQSRPGHDIVPLSLLLPLIVLVFIAVAGGDGELGNGSAARGVLDFGILAEVADENDFIDNSISWGWKANITESGASFQRSDRQSR